MSLVDKLLPLGKPFKAVDSAVKVAHDALADVVERSFGADRFAFAKYAVYCSAASLVSSSLFSLMKGQPVFLSFLPPIAAAAEFAMGGPVEDFYREYFTKPKNVLSYGLERYLSLFRKMRFPIFALGAGEIAFGVVASPNYYPAILSGGGFSLFASHLYLIDGNHATWDKAKQLPGKAYRSLASLLPKHASLPAPQPVAVPVETVLDYAKL